MYAGGVEKEGILAKDIARFRLALEKVKQETKLSDAKIIELLEEDNVPISIFNCSLGVLEALVKYMREDLGYPLSKIAGLLNRDARTIWSTYDNAKAHPRLDTSATLLIPINIFSLRKLGVLEALVTHLRTQGLRYSQIAQLIGRDQRTVWTVYNRAKKK